MYDEGIGVSQDYSEAANWFRKAAEQGHVKAQTDLGVMYYNGKGVPKNYTEAVNFYRQAANNGFHRAQIKLGKMYFDGKEIVKNDKEALRWFLKAAEQEDPVAPVQACLGFLYAYGEGIAPNYNEAIKWLRKAAPQGSSMAQTILPWMLATCPSAEVRNGKEAIKYALKLDDSEPQNLSIIAAAYARDNQFDKAIPMTANNGWHKKCDRLNHSTR